MYSLGLSDGTHYFFYYLSDWNVQVPGCYGEYRIGALGKLAALEKEKDLYRKTFAHTTSSFVDYYFYDSEADSNVYFGTDRPQQSLPSIQEILLSHSNASFLNRIYISLFFLKVPEKTIQHLNSEIIERNKSADLRFLYDVFAKQYRGFFYKKVLRNENKTVQIVYKHSYATAEGLSRIIEGEGIRVSDVTQGEPDINQCRVLYANKSISESAQVLSNYFDCPLKEGDTDIYDIILVLGSKEKEWEICE